MNVIINAVAKRYRYTGKERDEESGLYYHGARYYIPWLCRWSAVDPLESDYAGMNPYNYGFCNPVIFNDPSGNQPEGDDAQKQYEEGEKRTQEMFQSKIDEIVNSNANAEFKEWIQDIGVEGLMEYRDQIFERKLYPHKVVGLGKAMFGTDEEGNANVPYTTRKKLWNEAINETIPFVKDLWAVEMSGSTSGFLFTYYRNLTISNREEGWAAIREAGLTVGIEWTLHLSTGGAGNLAKLGKSSIKSSGVWDLPYAKRGYEIEKMLGGNLPHGFKTIDKFVDGVATSIKSMDLTADTYKNTSRLKSLLEGYINKLEQFEGAKRKGVFITKNMI